MIIAGAVIAGLIALFLVIWAARYEKAGPNKVLVISGGRRFRFVRGGSFVWPVRERVQRLSLELMTLDVRTPEVYTRQGVRITLDGVAQIKVKGDDASVALAAEQFLSRSREDIMRVALQVVDGYLRAMVGTLSVEDVYLKRGDFAEAVRQTASADLSKMGLEIVSLTIHHIRDEQGYLEALSRPRTAQVKRDAIVGEAEADREAQQARRDHEIARAQYEAEMRRASAEADLAYDLQRYRTSQQVKEAEIQVDIVEKERSIELYEKEIRRREKELIASVLKPVEVEKDKVHALAEAEKYRRETEAAGEAEAIKAQGFAQAEVVREQGRAEADTMSQKAISWGQYNEAAVAEMFVNILPKLAQAVSEPLSRTERIVIIGGGNGSAGAKRVTQDVADIISQLPPVIESLTGVKLEKLLERIPALRGKEKPEETAEG